MALLLKRYRGGPQNRIGSSHGLAQNCRDLRETNGNPAGRSCGPCCSKLGLAGRVERPPRRIGFHGVRRALYPPLEAGLSHLFRGWLGTSPFRGWLGTSPPERGRSTAQRSGGGRDPHPIPPLFKGREALAARSESYTIALPWRGEVGECREGQPSGLPEFGHKPLTAKIIPDATPAPIPGNDLTGRGELPMFRPTPVAGTAS